MSISIGGNAPGVARRLRSPRALAASSAIAACLAWSAIGPSDASAATTLPGTISSNTTLTAANGPYTGSNVTVTSGVTLTIEPGAVLKVTSLNAGSGTIIADGTEADPVVFTSIKDDAAGGDTNGDGSATSPGAGNWTGLTISSTSVIDDAVVRYATTGVKLSGQATLTDSTISQSSARGVEAGSSSAAGGQPEIAGNVVTDNGGIGIYYYAGNGTTATNKVKIHDNAVEGNGGAGIYVYAWTADGVSLSGNEVHDNAGRAIDYFGGGVLPPDIDDNPKPTGNGSNAVWFSGAIGQSVTWEDRDYPLVLSGNVTVLAGKTLTIAPGVLVKNTSASLGLRVSGTLDAQGTNADPIAFTSIKDDWAAGDTNQDGSTSNPAPGDWEGVHLVSSSASVLDHVEIRYAKNGVTTGLDSRILNSTIERNAWGGVMDAPGSNHPGGAPEIAGNVIRDNLGPGVRYYSSTGTAGTNKVNIHDNAISENTGTGIYVYAWTAEGQSLSDNTVSGNTGIAIQYEGFGNAVPPDIDDNPAPTGNGSNAIWLSGAVNQSVTWENRGYPIVLSGNVTVVTGKTLTIGPGSLIKNGAASLGLRVNGTLSADGTATEPVVFTSVKDDSVGGDTNQNGSANSPAPGDWEGVYLYGSTGSVLDNVEIRYAKNGVTTGLDSRILHSTIERNAWGGIADPPGSNHPGGAPEIAHNVVRDNAGIGISYYSSTGTAATNKVNIHDNTITGNAGNGIYVYAWTAGGLTLAGNEVHGNTGRAIEYFGGGLPADIDDNPKPTGNGSNAIGLGGSYSDSATWEARGYPIMLSGHVSMPAGKTLTLAPGTVVKLGSSRRIYASGTLNAQGTATEPIVLTSSRDDSVMGDTDMNGPSSPVAGDWGGISISSTATDSVLDHVRLAYPGGTAPAAIDVQCPCPNRPKLRNTRISDSGSTAIKVTGDLGAPAAGSFQGAIAAWNTFERIAGPAVDKSGTQRLSAPNNDAGCVSGPAPQGCGASYGTLVDHEPDRTDPDADGPCRGKRSGDAEHRCKRGADPIALASGAFTYEHTDLELSGKGQIPLNFSRSYSSSDRADSGLGPGWSHPGIVVASVRESGDVLVRFGDGRQELFTLGSGGFEPPAGETDALTQDLDGSYTLRTLDKTSYDFTPDGVLGSITDAHGQVLTYGYSASGRLASITDSAGQSLAFSYNASNHLTAVSDSTGRAVTLTYTQAGDLDTVTDALGGITNHDYDGQHRLTAITDPLGIRFIRNMYDSQGRVIEQEDGNGNVWAIRYSADQTVVTDPEGGEKTYGFDAQDRLTSDTNQLGHTTSYDYDAAGRISEITRPGGAATQLTHDSAGNLMHAIDPEGGERDFDYDSQNRLIEFTDERGKVWSYQWSGNDLVEITDPEQGVTAISYAASGQPETITDPNGHVRTLAYDARGNLTSLTNGDGELTTFAYDSRNQLTARSEPGKPAELYGRNALGDLLSLTTPEGHLTSYDYDQNGALVEITDPALETWTIERDGMERPTAYVDPLGQRTEITYDGNLNPVSITDRRQNTTTYAYDPANRLTEIDAPATGAWLFGYDARGNRDELTDPRGYETTYEFDLADRLTAVHEPLQTNTSYAYDPAGNLTSFTDPNGHTTSFAYDGLSRITEMTQPLGKVTSYDYDAVGNLTGRATAEDTLTFDHDAADRLTAISDGTTALRSFAYDDAARLIEAADAQSKTIEVTYDDDDRVVAISDGRGQSATRSFDSRGNLTQQVDGRSSISYAYDEINRMNQLTDPQSQMIGFDYDPEGNLTETTLPNGVVTTNTYDGANRMSSTSSARLGAVLQAFDYLYDPAGNRTSSTDRNSDVTNYAYDALNRLTEFDLPSEPPVTYGYDPAGNRIEAGGVTSSFNGLNQLTTSSDGTSYDYDGAGRLVEETNGTQTPAYSWDALDQLLEVDDGANPIAYSYDALGRRSERTEGSTTETAHYGDLSDLATLDTDTGGVVRSFVQGATGLVEQRSSQTDYPLADAHGDVTAIAEPTGTVGARQAYDPWGEQLSGPGLQFGWLGEHQRRGDSVSGLVQMGMRSYSQGQGRFVTEDPVVLSVGLGQLSDRYAYASNRPPNLTDLTGRSIFDDLADIGSSWWDDPFNFGNPTEMVTEAQDYWVNSDSPIAPVAGSAVSMFDVFINPSRVPHYLESHPWESSEVFGDCINGLKVGGAAGSAGGYAGGFAAGAASAGELGPVGAAYIGNISGWAGSRAGRLGGSVLGCGAGILAGL